MFPYGSAALAMLVLAILSGLVILFNPPPKKTATLTYWTFAKPHYEAYQRIVPEFEREHPGVTVDLQLVSNTGLEQRLQAAFQANLDVPDLCEIEISQAGSFFRGPLNDVGFADLTDRIKKDDLLDKMVASRFSPYMSRGHYFGLPHDIHPVQLAYRRDFFQEAGIDPNSIKTWDDFIRVGEKMTIPHKRYMLEMSSTGTDELEICLFQRNGGYFDPQGNVIFDNDIGVQTMEFYVPLVADGSKTQIGNSLASSFGSVIDQGMESGYFVCLPTPDWRSRNIDSEMAPLSGKMGLMPLPAVYPGGRRTSTWGGTMVGITKHCKNQDLAWELAKYFYVDPKEIPAFFEETNIVRPVRAAWTAPAFQEPRPFWGGQKLGASYIALADQVPPQYTSPFIDLAKGKLGAALVSCVQYYEQHGNDGFDAFVRETLKARADDVRAQMARNPF
jgi:arabinosaccharide transport system substrate-binding protein